MDMKDGGLVSTAVGTTFYMAPELLTLKRIAPTEVDQGFSNPMNSFDNFLESRYLQFGNHFF